MLGFGALVQILSAVYVANAVIVRDYNKVDFQEFNSLKQLLDESVDPESGEFFNNVLLGVANAECWDKLSSPAFVAAQRHASGGSLLPRSLPLAEFPHTLDHCAQLLLYRKGDSLERWSESFTQFDHPTLNRWLAEVIRVPQQEFVNGFSFDIEVFWHEEHLDPISQGVIPPGHSIVVGSFLGHIFSASAVHPEDVPEEYQFVTQISERKEQVEEHFNSPAHRNVVDYMVVDGDTYVFKPQNRLEVCEPNELPGATTYTYPSESHHPSCEDTSLRLIEFTHRVWYHERLALNFIQPQFIPAVTKNGFELRRLPPETHQWLQSWYYTHTQTHAQSEGGVGPCMNQQHAPSAITHLPDHLKERLTQEMVDVMQAWFQSGAEGLDASEQGYSENEHRVARPHEQWRGKREKLVRTSIYGIRRYHNQSVLRMHVDTANTHVVSAIINVDQHVSKPWPLVILDHDDNEHSVEMRPGDMLLYESAKLLHGRPEAMDGQNYDNIFIHFKPTEGWDFSWL